MRFLDIVDMSCRSLCCKRRISSNSIDPRVHLGLWAKCCSNWHRAENWIAFCVHTGEWRPWKLIAFSMKFLVYVSTYYNVLLLIDFVLTTVVRIPHLGLLGRLTQKVTCEKFPSSVYLWVWTFNSGLKLISSFREIIHVLRIKGKGGVTTGVMLQ